MTITGFETKLLRIPPASAWEDATCKVSRLEFVLVRICADSGLSGLGLAYTVGAGGSAIKALLDDDCRDLLTGQDALAHERVWSNLANHLRRTGSGGINTKAMAAIDIALWDIIAQTRGLPLYRALGGCRESMPAYGSGIDLFMNPGQFRSHLGTYLSQGYGAVKIKVGRETLAEDLERVAAARDLIGPGRKLLLDANQGWTAEEAVRRARAFEPYDPYWLEEPLIADDVEGHAWLRRKTSVPIAVGESLYTKHQFLSYLKTEAADILQPDVVRVGGITEWLKIAHLCEAWNKPVAPHFMVELSVHLLCGVPNGLILENVTGGSFADLGVSAMPPVTGRGFGFPPDVAGHGLCLDQERLCRFEVHNGSGGQ